MPQSAPPPFRIAHLSDLHLTPSDNIARTEVSLPGKGLKGMNQVFRDLLKLDEINSCDSIIITGDITDVGDNKSWRNFKKALVDAGVDKKTWIVAGNHDVCDMEWKYSVTDFFNTLTKSRQKKLLERLRFNLSNVEQPIQYPWKKIIDKKYQRVMLIGLDTNHSGHFYLHDNAVGRIGWGQLRKLESILKKHSNKNTPGFVPVKIIAMHHSPNIPQYETLVRRGILKESWFGARLAGKAKGQYIRWTHEIPQEERRALRELCLKYKVRLIIHGHMHEAMDRRVNGIRIIGAPASTQRKNHNGKINGYQYYQYVVKNKNNGLHSYLMNSI